MRYGVRFKYVKRRFWIVVFDTKDERMAVSSSDTDVAIEVIKLKKSLSRGQIKGRLWEVGRGIRWVCYDCSGFRNWITIAIARRSNEFEDNR